MEILAQIDLLSILVGLLPFGGFGGGVSYFESCLRCTG
jgi:hypothetical protein